MTPEQHTYAIIGMLAVVITLYALKESHTHYLPDLFGMALALAAPRQSMAIGAVLLLAVVRHSHLAHGLADRVPDWLLPIVLPAARNMSSVDEDYSSAELAYQKRILKGEADLKYVEIPQPVAENQDERIDLEKADLLARLVLAGAVGKTRAIQIGAGAQSGKKYQRWSRLVSLAIERQTNHYHDLDDQHRRA